MSLFNDDNDVLSGVSRALCLDQVGQNDGKADTNIEVVLHHKVFLAKKSTCVQMAKILKTMLTIRPWMQGRWRHQRAPCRVRSHQSVIKCLLNASITCWELGLTEHVKCLSMLLSLDYVVLELQRLKTFFE